MERRGGNERARLVVAARTEAPVTTLGGLRVVPETTLDRLAADDISLLILPGGNTWLTEDHTAALDLASARLAGGGGVAGICGANSRPGPRRCARSPGACRGRRCRRADYPGSRYRVHASVAHDGFLITAIGEAPLEFSREIFKLMQLEDVDQWYASFKKSVPDAS